MLQLRNLSISIEGKPLTRDPSLAIEPGCIHGLYGPSGVGKSSLLNAIGGFHEEVSGVIELDNHVLFDTNTNVTPAKRHVGFVFQSHLLFPNMTVTENIKFGSMFQEQGSSLDVDTLLEMLQIQHRANAYPSELSGGEQQRVAIGRALAASPRLLLLDEPFSSLDSHLSKKLQCDLATIVRELNIPCLLVTHNLSESLSLCKSMTVLFTDAKSQTGTYSEIAQKPASLDIAKYLKSGVLLESKSPGKLRYAPFSDFSLKSSDVCGDCKDSVAVDIRSVHQRNGQIFGDLHVDNADESHQIYDGYYLGTGEDVLSKFKQKSNKWFLVPKDSLDWQEL